MGISRNTARQFIVGDSYATGLVFEEYKNLMYFVIASYVSNSDDCDDLLSESFIKIIQHKNEIKDIKNLKSFCVSIARNEALMFLRNNKISYTDTIDEIYGEEDRYNLMLNELGSMLSNKETIIIYYRAVFSYSWKEIVLATGIPESSAKKIYSEAKKKMRKVLL